MKKIAITAACVLASMNMWGQSMVEIWKSMPDSIVPYIDAGQRREMADMAALGLTAEANHLLHGKSCIDTLTNSYLRARLNESVEMQIKKLPRHGADSVLCVVTTWHVGEGESRARFYDGKWQRLDGASSGSEGSNLYGVDVPDVWADGVEWANGLTARPDLVLASYKLMPDANKLMVEWSLPLASIDDKKLLARQLQPIMLQWNGTRFAQ